MHAVCGYGFEALAQEMGITEPLAKIYIARAFMVVQRRLDEEESAPACDPSELRSR